MNEVPIKTWTVPADLENVNRICSEISAWLTEHDLSDHFFPLELLVREAFNNAVIHGSQMDSSRTVRMEFSRDGDHFSLKVQDDGPGFDWESLLQTDMVGVINEHGRGLTLYQLYADQVKFNEKGNQVILIRHINDKTKPKSIEID